MALARESPYGLSNISCPGSHDVLAILIGTFGNVAVETHMRVFANFPPDLVAQNRLKS